MSKAETKTLVFVFGRDRKIDEHVHDELHGVLAMVGIKRPIVPVTASHGVQHLLVEGTPSVVQYLIHMWMNHDLMGIRTAVGEPCKDMVAKFPENVHMLMPLREFFMHSPVELTEWNHCIEMHRDFEWPEWVKNDELIVLRKRLLNENLVVKTKTELHFGHTCTEMKHKIKMEAEWKRGEDMTEWARNKSPLAKKCIDDEKKGFTVSKVCLKVAKDLAAALNLGKIEVTWTENLPVPFKRIWLTVEDFIKYTFFNYMHHEHYVDDLAGERKIVIDWHMKPDKEFMHLVVVQPESRLMLKNIKTSWWMKLLLPITPTRTLVEHINKRVIHPITRPFCTLESNHINTFDNVTYKFDMNIAPHCDHVLTQDCSGRWPMAVFVRDIHTDTKVVTVLLPGATKIEIMPVSRSPTHWIRKETDQLRVLVNGEIVNQFPRMIYFKDSHRDMNMDNNFIAKIDIMVHGGIQVITPRLHVATDCNRVVLRGDNAYRNRTCGLCGDFDGEKTAEFKSPKNCPLSTGSLLVASYAFPPIHGQGQCNLKPELKNKILKEEKDCLEVHRHMPLHKPVLMEDPEPISKMLFDNDMDMLRRFERVDNECYTFDKLVRRPPGHGVCYSEQPIRTCAPECKAKDVVRKMVWFECVDFTYVTAMSQSFRKELYVDLPTECVRGL
jgi:hypothetical protein